MQKTTCLRKFLGFKMVRSGVSHASSQSPWLPNSEALAPEVNTALGGLPAALPVIKEQERSLPWMPKIPLWATEDLLSAVNFTIRATLSPSPGAGSTCILPSFTFSVTMNRILLSHLRLETLYF